MGVIRHLIETERTQALMCLKRHVMSVTRYFVGHIISTLLGSFLKLTLFDNIGLSEVCYMVINEFPIGLLVGILVTSILKGVITMYKYLKPSLLRVQTSLFGELKTRPNGRPIEWVS